MLFDDGDQHIYGNGNPDLSLDCVLRCAIKLLDASASGGLFDPFEKQLYLPAELVQLSNDQGRKSKVVSVKHEPFATLGVYETDAPEVHWVLL